MGAFAVAAMAVTTAALFRIRTVAQSLPESAGEAAERFRYLWGRQRQLLGALAAMLAVNVLATAVKYQLNNDFAKCRRTRLRTKPARPPADVRPGGRGRLRRRHTCRVSAGILRHPTGWREACRHFRPHPEHQNGQRVASGKRAARQVPCCTRRCRRFSRARRADSRDPGAADHRIVRSYSSGSQPLTGRVTPRSAKQPLLADVRATVAQAPMRC